MCAVPNIVFSFHCSSAASKLSSVLEGSLSLKKCVIIVQANLWLGRRCVRKFVPLIVMRFLKDNVLWRCNIFAKIKQGRRTFS